MPITWRNINTPNFSASNNLLSSAVNNISGGLDSISQTNDKRIADITKKNTDAALGNILSATNQEEYDALQPNLNPEALQDQYGGRVDVLKVLQANDTRDDTIRNQAEDILNIGRNKVRFEREGESHDSKLLTQAGQRAAQRSNINLNNIRATGLQASQQRQAEEAQRRTEQEEQIRTLASTLVNSKNPEQDLQGYSPAVQNAALQQVNTANTSRSTLLDNTTARISKQRANDVQGVIQQSLQGGASVKDIRNNVGQFTQNFSLEEQTAAIEATSQAIAEASELLPEQTDRYKKYTNDLTTSYNREISALDAEEKNLIKRNEGGKESAQITSDVEPIKRGDALNYLIDKHNIADDTIGFGTSLTDADAINLSENLPEITTKLIDILKREDLYVDKDGITFSRTDGYLQNVTEENFNYKILSDLMGRYRVNDIGENGRGEFPLYDIYHGPNSDDVMTRFAKQWVKERSADINLQRTKQLNQQKRDELKSNLDSSLQVELDKYKLRNLQSRAISKSNKRE